MEKQKFRDILLIVCIGITLFVFLINYIWIINIVEFLWNLFLPFTIGFIFAFILNVLVRWFENKPFKKLKTKRVLSIVLSLIVVFGSVIALLMILMPQVENAGRLFAKNFPEYQRNVYSLGEKIGLSDETLDMIDLGDASIKDKIVNYFSDNNERILKLTMGFANSLVNAFANFFIGLIFALYILGSKETLKRQIKKLLKRISKSEIYDKIIKVASLSNTTFGNYVKVQVLEAIILGILCFIGMLILRLPYSMTISVLVAFTALIPIFGSLFGCAIGAFLIFMVSPVQALIFIIFFIILQQIEGNLIYPHVVGDKIGLPSIWVLVAVTIGGSIGGILGMLIGVPVVSVVYTLLKEFVNTKPKRDKLSTT